MYIYNSIIIVKLYSIGKTASIFYENLVSFFIYGQH
jgi:hypothetical protein